MDRIWLYGIECRARLGVPAQERRRPQRILIDVGLELELAPAAAQDDFRLTVDYAGVERTVRELAQSRERKLVEALAEEVAALLLGREKRLSAVTVAVRKKPAAMPETREVVVEVRRQRR